MGVGHRARKILGQTTMQLRSLQKYSLNNIIVLIQSVSTVLSHTQRTFEKKHVAVHL